LGAAENGVKYCATGLKIKWKGEKREKGQGCLKRFPASHEKHKSGKKKEVTSDCLGRGVRLGVWASRQTKKKKKKKKKKHGGGGEGGVLKK